MIVALAAILITRNPWQSLNLCCCLIIVQVLRVKIYYDCQYFILNTLFLNGRKFLIIFYFQILAFVSMCLISGWLGSGGSGSLSFFAYATTHTWVALLVILILQFLKVPSCCSIFNWNLTVRFHFILPGASNLRSSFITSSLRHIYVT